MSFGLHYSNPAPAGAQSDFTLSTSSSIRTALVPVLLVAVAILATCTPLVAAPPQRPRNEHGDQPPIARVPEEQQRRKLVSGRQPEYPESVRAKGIQGTVKLDVRIDEDGRVMHIRVVSGHPMLSTLAVDAVKTWRFHATYVDGVRAAVLSQFRIQFPPPPPENSDQKRRDERQRKA